MSEEISVIKIVMLGDSGSGKTCIVNRYFKETFNPNQDSTVGASFFTKLIEISTITIKLSVWDTSGQEKYDNIAALYCRNAQAFIIVSDITSSNPKESIEKWYSKGISENRSENIPIFIIINKIDLSSPNDSDLIREIEQFSDSISAIVLKTSALENTNIKQLFDRIIAKIKPSMIRKSLVLSSSRHSEKIATKKCSTCCKH